MIKKLKYAIVLSIVIILGFSATLAINLKNVTNRDMDVVDYDNAKSRLTPFKDLEFEEDYGEFANWMTENRNNDFVYTYGSISDENATRLRDELFSTYIDFPTSFEKYINDGGIIVIASTWDEFNKMSDDLFYSKIKNENSSHVAGYILYDNIDETPNVICLSYGRMTKDAVGDEDKDIENSIIEFMNWGATLKHEFAHYIDIVYGFSDTDEFNRYFKEYAVDYVPRGAIAEDYQLKNEKEFFAILTADIMGYQDSVLNIPADLYDYMYNCLYESDGIIKE